MRYGPTDPSYWGPNGELPTNLQALAEACERAAEDARLHICCTDWPRAVWCDDCTQADEDSDLLARHARALREGRVTVREGGET